MMPGSPEILIVGGGVIGLSIARALHIRGARNVAVIDAGTCGGEASWAAGGMLSPQVEADETGPFFDLCSRSRDLYPSFADELLEETGVDIELDRSGTFYLAFSGEDSEKLRERFDRQKDEGLTLELVDSDSVRKAEPLVSPDVFEALFFAGDWQVDNRKLCLALRRYCKLNQITLIENKAVADVVVSNGRVSGIRCGLETITAAEVIIASGAWTSKILLDSRTMPVGVEPVLGQIIMFRAEKRPFRHVMHCGEGYLVPRADGRILAGSTTEKTGFERKTTDAAAASLFSMACRISAVFAEMSIEDHWCGFRPRAADGFPVMGRIEGIDGLFFATAHYRNGILLAPLTAAIAADNILTGDLSVDLAVFGPERFRAMAGGVSN